MDNLLSTKTTEIRILPVLIMSKKYPTGLVGILNSPISKLKYNRHRGAQQHSEAGFLIFIFRTVRWREAEVLTLFN